MHRRVQVEVASQLMLPLAPTVTSHVEPCLHSMLHDDPHAPVQSLWSVQPSVQLEPAQAESPMSHALCASHVHDEPVQAGGGGLSPPQATRSVTSKKSLGIATTILLLRDWHV